MRFADIPFAIRATNLEGWGFEPADFRRLLRLDPGGCFMAVAGGKRVGLTTATSYGTLGWIGNVIVLPEHRGKGIGLGLVSRALDYLEANGAETVRLNSYLERRSFYEGLDFRAEFENIRFHGRLTSSGSPSRMSRVPGLRDLESFDRRFFGASRGRLLASLRKEFPDTFVACGEDGLRGFLVGQVSGGACEIAPWVVDPTVRGDARGLWRALAARIGETQAAFTAPVLSRQAWAIARWARLEQGLKTIRMYHGKKAHGGIPEGILGVGGLEKG